MRADRRTGRDGGGSDDLRRRQRAARAKLGFLRFVCTACYVMFIGVLAFLIIAGVGMCVVPVSLTLLANGIGVTYESKLLDMLILLGMPSLFVTGAWLYASVALIRWLNRKLRASFDSLYDSWSRRVAV